MIPSKPTSRTKTARTVRKRSLKSPKIAASPIKPKAVQSIDAVKTLLGTAKRVLRIEAEAIAGLIERLDERFENAVELLHGCKGRIVVTGLGKSGLIGRKIAATFASTGSPSFFLHAAEALHGDLGMLTSGDILLSVSSSGETDELIELLEAVKRLGIRLITLTAQPQSTLLPRATSCSI